MPCQFDLRAIASRYVRLLQRILQRFGKVLIGDLKVMLLGNGFGVADP